MTDSFRPGDRVRCTLGESVIVGTVSNDSAYPGMGAHGFYLDPDGCDGSIWIKPPWSVEKIEPELPPEPPVGTVLRGKNDGLVWYCREEGGWEQPGTSGYWGWDEVCQANPDGLVRLVEQPDNGPLVSLDELLCWLESERLAHPIAGWLKAALAERYGGKQP